MSKICITILALCAVVCAGVAWAGNPKTRYWLFHPTPRDQMRKMTIDRPDTTETPHTVDAGHFQIEISVATYTHDGWNDDNARTNGFSILQSMLKLGITNTMDIEVGLEPYVHNSTFDLSSSTEDIHNGFGDVVPRVKLTLWGNDGGPFSVALLPFVKFPTNQDGIGNTVIEAGLTIPYIFEFSDEWSMGGQTQYNASRRTTNDGYVPEFINTIEVSHAFTDRLGGFLEFYANVTTEKTAPWVGRVNGGVTYAVTSNFVLDAAVNVGVTKSADDVNPFFGFSWRH